MPTVPANGYMVYIKGEPAIQYLIGDVNNDGELSIGDVTALVNVILSHGGDSDTRKRADVNNDGEVTIADVTALINIILKGGN